MYEIKEGMEVHYVHPNGTHSPATITQVRNAETGVVDLLVKRNDHIQSTYTAATVVHREEPIPYTWHFIEKDQQNDQPQDTPA